MKPQWMVAGLALSLVGTLAACVGGGPGGVDGDAIKPQIAAELTVSAAAKLDPSLKPRLVGRYYTINAFEQNNNNVKRMKLEPKYDELKYKPNASAFPGFENWDVLEMRKVNNTRSDYVRLTLTRDAKVAVLSSSRLSWMDGAWTEGTLPDKTTKTFVKSFPGGEAVLGAPAKDDAYTTLIAEGDGTASKYPGVPAGVTGATQPKANETCPAWLENAYVTTGPDGDPKKLYKSWHPQIDPVYHCYFRHEHGSDPALVGLPGFPLEYVAEVNNNQAEIHQGFKGIAIRDEEKKIGWYINIHSETHDLHRVCAQNHTVAITVTDLTKTFPDNILAQISYKGDFGASIANRKLADTNVVIDNVTSFKDCPNQTAIANGLKDKDGNPIFFKRIRVENLGDGKLDNGGYESWQGGLTAELGLSVAGWFGGATKPRFEIDIRNPSTTCSDKTCANPKPNEGNSGDERTFFVPELKLEYNIVVRTKDEVDGAPDGTFYTDVYGVKVLAAGPNAIKQYIKPGLNISGPDGGFHSEDAWRGLYADDNDTGVPRLELDNAFGALN